MQNFKITETGSKTVFNQTQKSFQLHKTNKSEISIDEIKAITSDFLNKAPNGTKLRIRGLGIDKYNTINYVTLKGLNEQLQILDEEDYLDGKVKDTSKFKRFSQIEFTVIKQVN